MAENASHPVSWTLIGLLVAIIGSLAFAGFLLRQDSTEEAIRGEAALWYCSDPGDASCQAGVATVDLEFHTRHTSLADLYGYEIPKDINVMLRSLTLRLNTQAEAAFGPEAELFVHADADGDGVLGASDPQIVRGLFQGKRVVFEDINERLSAPSEGFWPATSSRLFVVFDDPDLQDIVVDVDGEPTKLPLIKGIEVEALDLAVRDRFVEVRTAFADRSAYANIDLVGATRQEFLERHPEFQSGSDEAEIVLTAGSYEFADDVIIPEGMHLHILAGAVLSLAPGKSLVSYSPTTIAGTAAAPVQISSTGDEPFGVVGVIGKVNEPAQVSIAHLHVSRGSEAEINGAFLSGMVSVYRIPDVVVTNSIFSDARADDALNVKYGQALIDANQFVSNSADAFDGDFVSGLVTRNSFVANGNDAVDFSGSDIVVKENTIASSGDKCASVGERTTAVITRNVFNDCEIGVEVKDASDATIEENLITDSRSYAVNAYVKKDFFGEPTLVFANNVVLGQSPVYGGLALDRASDSNTTTGSVSTLEQELSWLAETLAATPNR